MRQSVTYQKYVVLHGGRQGCQFWLVEQILSMHLSVFLK